MRHAEAVEPRLLFTSLSPDPSFNGGVGVTLPATVDSGVLATHGAVYVIGFNDKQKATYLYKYTSAGKLDTSWGNGGAVKPLLTADRGGTDDVGLLPQLAYDPGTGGLLLSDGDPYRPARIERFTAGGKDDTAWGDGGLVTLSDRNAKLTIDRLLPLSGKRVMVAYKQVQQNGMVYYGEATPGGASDVYLARVNRLGHFDRKFNGGKPVVAAGGHIRGAAYIDTINPPSYPPVDQNLIDHNDPIFGDLIQTRSGYRLVVTREKTEGITVPSGIEEFALFTGTEAWSAETIDVSDAGTVAPAKTVSLYHARFDRSSNTVRYEPVVSRAHADGTASLLFDGPFRDESGRHPGEALQVSGDTITSRRLVDDVDSYSDLYSDAAGTTYVAAGKIYRLNPDLTPDPKFKASAVPRDGLQAAAVDDSGRLLTINTVLSAPPVLHRYRV